MEFFSPCPNSVPVGRGLRCFHGVLLPGETRFRCPGRGGPLLPVGIVSKARVSRSRRFLTRGTVTSDPGSCQGIFRKSSWISRCPRSTNNTEGTRGGLEARKPASSGRFEEFSLLLTLPGSNGDTEIREQLKPPSRAGRREVGGLLFSPGPLLHGRSRA